MLTQFEIFLERFSAISDDEKVSMADTNVLMDELAELSIYIRKDLIGDIDIRLGINQQQLSRQILSNSDALQ